MLTPYILTRDCPRTFRCKCQAREAPKAKEEEVYVTSTVRLDLPLLANLSNSLTVTITPGRHLCAVRKTSSTLKSLDSDPSHILR